MHKLILSLFLFVSSAFADEIRPGYLELNQQAENTFSVLWKIPQKKAEQSLLVPLFPKTCSKQSTINSTHLNGALIQRWYIQCSGIFAGQSLGIMNIEKGNVDVLLRIKWLDGLVSTALLKPSGSSYTVPEKSTGLDIATTYLVLGVEHILLGLDHLLFVFALLLIVNNTRRLIVTITAFTVAHSITLGAATLGFVHVPQQPVEAVIALSILFLAVEYQHGEQGRIGAASKWPWLVAFIFGLLHGFGFAGALAEIGLPEQSIPLALVFFNVGVEMGQLLFITVVLICGWILLKLKRPLLFEKLKSGVIYIVGSLSAFWLIERVSSF